MIQRIKKTKDDKERCDELFAAIIKYPGSCRKCGRGDLLTTAHYVPRRYSRTRTDLRNACCLCMPCHRKLTDNPKLHDAFVISLIGEQGYEELKRKAQTVTKVDWATEKIRLKKVLDSLTT